MRTRGPSNKYSRLNTHSETHTHKKKKARILSKFQCPFFFFCILTPDRIFGRTRIVRTRFGQKFIYIYTTWTVFSRTWRWSCSRCMNMTADNVWGRDWKIIFKNGWTRDAREPSPVFRNNSEYKLLLKWLILRKTMIYIHTHVRLNFQQVWGHMNCSPLFHHFQLYSEQLQMVPGTKQKKRVAPEPSGGYIYIYMYTYHSTKTQQRTR